MQEVHAILLSGGSAFGLAAADGVMRWLEERGLGYKTPWARIPIVPTAVVYDLNVGSNTIRPDTDAGYEACNNATEEMTLEGNIGAGTGATIGKWNGIEFCMKGGVGSVSQKQDELVVGAIAIVNAVGDVINSDGSVLAGAKIRNGAFLANANPLRTLARGKVQDHTNTTLIVVATNAQFSKLELFRIAQRIHDGMARAIVPCHTSFDGDVSFALSTGNIQVNFDIVAEMATYLSTKAIRQAVRSARSIGSIPGLAG